MKVLSDKEIRVTTTWGGVFVLFPNEPQELAEEAAILAMSMGAKQIDGTTVEPSIEEESEESDDVSFDELVDQLVVLMDEGNPSNFKNDNTPKAAVVNKLAGKTLSSEQRDAAWEEALRR